MANSNRGSFAKIGFTVLIGVAAVVGTLIYIGGLRDRGPVTVIETYYNKGVSGLSVGSPVNMRGVKIGEVKEISFVGFHYDVGEYDSSRIYVRMELSHRLMGYDRNDSGRAKKEAGPYLSRLVSKGLRAQVASNGITGLSRIELDFFPPEKATPIEQIAWTPHDFLIPPQISLLDNFSDSATKVMNQINRMDLNAISSNVAASVDAIAKATESMKVMIEVRQGDIDKICDNLVETANMLRDAAQEIQRNPSLLIRERRSRTLPETER